MTSQNSDPQKKILRNFKNLPRLSFFLFADQKIKYTSFFFNISMKKELRTLFSSLFYLDKYLIFYISRVMSHFPRTPLIILRHKISDPPLERDLIYVRPLIQL